MTYGPHVDQASAQERVQAPVYTGQAGDVEDFMAQACRDQEEEVQQPVPHLVLRSAAALQAKHTNEPKIWWDEVFKDGSWSKTRSDWIDQPALQPHPMLATHLSPYLHLFYITYCHLNQAARRSLLDFSILLIKGST